MKLNIDNVGPLKNVSLRLGNMTIISGKNNNGKSYLAYTIYSLLATISRNFVVPVMPRHLNSIYDTGAVTIDIADYKDSYVQTLKQVLRRFSLTLPRFLSMRSDSLSNANITIDVEDEDFSFSLNDNKDKITKSIFSINRFSELVVTRRFNSTRVEIILSNMQESMPKKDLLANVISRILTDVISSSLAKPLFPDAFIITCERTGVSLFSKELLEVRERKDLYIDQITEDKYEEVRYQLPVEKEILFIRNLGDIVKRRSFIDIHHPEVLKLFNEIAGGDYYLDAESKSVRFKLKQGNSLSLVESSSTSRSMSELYFYLKHCAKKGQLLMIDEPELNLHPASQRKLARLLAMLMNIGIQVFITTHSDYIVRELNALTKLKTLQKQNRVAISSRYIIELRSLVDYQNINVYVLEDGQLLNVKYNRETGSFPVFSFDQTINEYIGLNESLSYLQ